jgi:hypothetical protein
VANRKISQLTALTTPAAGDYLPIVDISEAADADKNKRITIEELLRGAPNGTAAAPSIAFESDANTGIYSPGADQVAISTNGTGRLFINNTGLVGIGTSNPSNSLHVFNSTADVILKVESGDSISRIELKDNVASNYISTVGANLDFAVNGVAAAMRITSAGNVGIGTTAASALLHLRKDANSTVPGDSASIVLSNRNTTLNGNIAGGIFVDTFRDISDPAYSAGIWFTRIAGGGNLSSKSDIIFGNQGTAGTGLPSESARIDSSGRLLVGTSSSPSAVNGSNSLLVVQGQAASSGAGGYVSIQKGEPATSITTNEEIGAVNFGDNAGNTFAYIRCRADADAGAGDYPGRLEFSTTANSASTPTERMRITSDAYVRLAAGSGGIQFNGDTAAANALDDYEEGTFTPTIIGTATAGTATYTGQAGKYTKVGNLVTCLIYLNYSGGTGAGNLRIAGLPFTVVNGGSGSISVGIFSNIALAANSVATGYAAELTSEVVLTQYASGGGQYAFIAYDAAGEILASFAYYS